MLTKRGFRKFITIFLNFLLILQISALGLFLNPQKARAANCGDIITSDFTLTNDLTCTGHGLIIGASGITIDGGNHTITGDGDFGDYGINNFGGWDNITIKNFANITNFGVGIYFNGSTGSTIQNNTTNLNRYHGIYLVSSSSNTLTNNTANANSAGIFFSGSSSNNLTSNTIDSNYWGIYLNSSSSSNTLTGNAISHNINDISENGTNTFSNNEFSHNIGINSRMLTFTEVARTKNLNDTVSFDISIFDANGNPCSDSSCSYTIATSPSETVNSNKVGNNVTGSFNVTKVGIYSLIFSITDSNNNVTKRNYLFFVNATGSTTTKYYLREVDPTHGQAKGSDAGSLLFTPPLASEQWSCSIFVQNSPDEIPDYPLSNLSGIDIYSWYMTEDEGFIGVQRFASYDTTVDYSSIVPPASDYTWINKNFTELNWGMDYPNSWYWLSLKLEGTTPYWQTNPTQPSYADFTYNYTTTPAIKSISNLNIIVLSATATATDSNNATLVLDGSGSTNIVLDNYKRPFAGYTTTINSDGTATIAANNLSGETTINSVKMDITPNAGSVAVNIDTWNTSGTYYKKWTESGSGVASAIHTIGDLKANTNYYLKVNGNWLNNYQSDSNGNITFTYAGGYSTKTFEVGEDVTTPTTSFSVNPSTPDGDNGYYKTAPTITLSATDSESGVSKTYYKWDSNSYQEYSQALTAPEGEHTLYYYSTDNADNTEAEKSTTIKVASSYRFSQTQIPYSSSKNNPKTVIVLQNILKYLGYFPSHIKSTGYYGKITKWAVYLYQKAKGIVKSWRSWGAGWFGPKTKKALNEDIQRGRISPSIIESAIAESQAKVKFPYDLYVGSSGYYVVKLQQRLAEEGYLNQRYITGYFGSITKRAVLKYQKAHKIDLSRGGAGRIGPRTRAVLNSY